MPLAEPSLLYHLLKILQDCLRRSARLSCELFYLAVLLITQDLHIFPEAAHAAKHTCSSPCHQDKNQSRNPQHHCSGSKRQAPAYGCGGDKHTDQQRDRPDPEDVSRSGQKRTADPCGIPLQIQHLLSLPQRDS